MRRKCIICNTRPVEEGQTAGYCKVCSDQIRSGQSARSAQDEVHQYLTYRGKVIALIPSEMKAGVQMYKCVRVFKNPDTLPKTKTINLNVYQEGFDREQIKRMKKQFAMASS